MEPVGSNIMIDYTINNTLNILSKYVPSHLISKALLVKCHNSTEQYLSKYNLSLASNNLVVNLKKILVEELNRSLKEQNLSIIISLSPNIYNKALRAACKYIQYFVPWALTKCNLSHEQIDEYMLLIFYTEMHYDLIEDIIDRHNKSEPISAIFISKFYQVIINLIRNIFKSDNYAVNLFNKYHDQYMNTEIGEKSRSLDETINLWENSKLISDKAAPAKLLFTFPLLINNKFQLIDTYEKIMDHWTIFLQMFDDMMDIEEDLVNHNYGIGLALYNWLLKEKKYDKKSAIESVKFGTGFRIGLERCLYEMEEVIKLSLSVNDLLVAYTSYYRKGKTEEYIKLNSDLFNLS